MSDCDMSQAECAGDHEEAYWETTAIRSFHGRETGFLSNFAESPILIDGHFFDTVEHYYQASKSDNQEDFDKVRSAGTPGESKRLGREIPVRKDWDLIKTSIMMRGLVAKFTQNDKLRWKLQATGDLELIEGNHWHDNIWGVCSCDKCKHIKPLNLLGKLLMVVRDIIEE